MKKKKLAVNILYNMLNQLVALVVPIILSPYVARVLSPELIGEYSYSLANSSYFVLIECLGLSLYGMLEVSAHREDIEYISKVFLGIMFIKIALMLGCIIAYGVPFILLAKNDRWLNTVMILNIASSGIDTTWFLTGLEEYKITVMRNVLVRAANVLLVCILVKSERDFAIYAIIMQLSSFISYAIIIPTVISKIEIVKVSRRDIDRYLKTSMAYFVPGLINTIFTSADKTVLGAFANKYEVGVYEQASKISTLCGSLINSISNVILPRVTYLNHGKNKEEAKKLLYKTIRYAAIMAIAVTFGIFCIAEEFIPIFFGAGYEKSAILLKILAVNVLMSVLANYLGQQCLISNRKQKEYNIAITVGAVLNVIMNLLTVGRLQSVGISISSAISGMVVFGIVLLYSKNLIRLRDILKMSWKAIVSGGIMTMIVYPIHYGNMPMLELLIKITVGAFAYVIMLIILREEGILKVSETIKAKL